MVVLKLERSVEGLFDQFWSDQLRKIGKGAARKEYYKHATTQELAREINAKWLEQKDYYRDRSNEKEIDPPHPRTWLSQERWEDELEEQKGPRY